MKHQPTIKSTFWRTGLALFSSIIVSADTAAQDSSSREDNIFELEAFEVMAKEIGFNESRSTYRISKTQIELQVPGGEITQSLEKVPGIQVSTGDARGGSFSFEIYMRGLSDEQIGFSVDGIPTGDSRFNGGQPPNRFVDTGNVSQIAVSQSSGEIGSPSRFALGGFIDFVTDDPSYSKGIDLDFSFGSFDYRRGSIRVDTGEIADGLTGYVSFSHKDNENYAGRKSRSSERQHMDLKFKKEYENGSSVSIRGSKNDLEDNDFNIVSLTDFESDPTSDQAGDEITGIPGIDADFGGALGGTREDWLWYINADFKLANYTSFEVNPYYHTLRGESFRYQNRSRRLDGGNPRAVTGYNDLGGAIRPNLTTLRDSNTFGGPADLRITPRDRDRYGFTAEFLAEDVADKHNLKAGLWYEENETTEFRNFFPILDPTQSIDINRNDLAYVQYERTANVDTTMLYAQDQLSLMDDQLKIDFGFNYIDVSYEATSPLEYNTPVSFSQDSGILPKVGFSYQLSESVELFGGVAQNFGGIPEDVFLGSSSVINPTDLDPIKTDNLDLGIRAVFENSLISVQAYTVDLDNNIGIVPTSIAPGDDIDDIIRGNASTRATNLLGVDTLGLEVTAFRDFGRFDIYTSYSYQEAEHKDTSSPAELENLARNGIIAEAGVRDIPNNSLFVQIGVDVTDKFRVEANVDSTSSRVGGHLLSPIDFSSLGIERIDGRTLTGLNLYYKPDADSQFSNLSFQLNVENLLDEEYISAVSGATATLPEFGVFGGSGLDRYFIGFPRTYTFSVSADF